MEKIKLSKIEKIVFLNIRDNGAKPPRNVTPTLFSYSVAKLKEKGLINAVTSYDDIVAAELTTKGKAYLEQNPKLKNPIDWIKIITLIMSIITAIATSAALFISCKMK